MPSTGHATVRVLERTYSLRRLVMRIIRVFMLRREIEQLRRLRQALEADVVRAVERYRPTDMEPLYPRSTRERAPAKDAGGTG